MPEQPPDPSFTSGQTPQPSRNEEPPGTGDASIELNPENASADDTPEQTENPSLPFTVVGIGTAVGEADSYLELFRSLPSDTGMAFVFLQHHGNLEHPPLEALSPHTDMPVVEIQSGLRPEPNHIYVLNSPCWVTLVGGLFMVESFQTGERDAALIDNFFYSLAADQKGRAIGVVLSGMDGDGALGLKTVKGNGGFALVQQPETARHPSMPRASILADHVDLVLPPAQIGAELARLASQFAASPLDGKPEQSLTAKDDQHFTRILQLLRSVSGVDFRLYRRETLRRRIIRRMMLQRKGTLLEYIAYLQAQREELGALQEDLLINVTHFFRDESMFQLLCSDVLPSILENRRPDQQLRIWVAGCSTGEEVYSIAICLLETLSSPNYFEPPIQVFGTDASESSIAKARTAIYPESIARHVSPERLRRFFSKVDQGYQISKRVRDLCIFASQNLCTDPPFSRLDLISCRNVLIYFGTELQKQIIPTFHYALRPNGYLVLGPSESIREFSDLFTAVHRKAKIFTKVSGNFQVNFDIASRLKLLHEPIESGHTPNPSGWNEIDWQRAADRIVLARFGPAGVVVNERLEVVQTRGHTAPYLKVNAGVPGFNLMRLVRDDLAATLRQAVAHTMEHDVPVQLESVPVREQNGVRHVTIEVLPIPGPPYAARHFLVLFALLPPQILIEQNDAVQELPADAGPELTNREIARLRQDLASTQNYLRSLITERDSRNQELVTANEEAQSSNEELQSTNEELETAKEELQSANEELNTLNDELQNRNAALTQSGNDLANLLTSVNIPVLMLNGDLHIRSFTPPAQRLMNVRPSDIGRPVGEIRLNLQLENPEGLFAEVLDTLATKELEVQDRDGRWHILRARPYRTTDNRIEGVVAVLLDIDQVRRTQNEMQAARDFAQTVIESAQVPLVVLDQDLRIHLSNASFRSLSGLKQSELDRRAFPDLVSHLWGMNQLRSKLEELSRNPEIGALEVEYETAGPSSRVLCINLRAVQPEGKRALLVTLEDITPRRQAELLLKRERDRLAGQVEVTNQALGRTQEELRALTANLFTSQEETSRRIARELHDDLGQRLARLEMALAKLHQQTNRSAPAIAEDIAALQEQAAGLSQDLRQVSHRLHPSILDHLGLAAALRSLADQFGSRGGMLATFLGRNVPDTIPRDTATAFYRIAQEALRNVEKHAGPTHVKIILAGAGQKLRLTVRDFGNGFDMNRIGSRGLGLLSIEERARLIGGALSVHSEAGEGTTVEVTVLLPGEPG